MLIRIIVTVVLILVFDLYAFQAIKVLTENLNINWRRGLRISFWVISLLFYVLAFLAMGGYFVKIDRTIYVVVTGLFMAMFLAKVLMMVPMVLEDVYRIFEKIVSFFRTSTEVESESKSFLVGRKKFISQISAGIGGLTFAGLSYGIIKGAHDYKVHRTKVSMKGLPDSFKGLKIGHLSDIHSGSFWDKRAVVKGIQKLMNEKPDVIFFTGDLVNSLAAEMNDEYIAIFSQLKAPLGVFSILGNHDYGDYHNWPDATEFRKKPERDKSHMSPMQKANLESLIAIHKQMGWDILLNENRLLERNGESIALIGVENYGAKGNFPKYGFLEQAIKGVEAVPVKILLSHDPSHWEKEVTKSYTDIQLTLSGHTHGAQFGIESAWIKWSPVKYMYKQWAGLYNNGEQFLYVNRGFGYLGYPGRLGIRPEIGIISLA